MSVRIRRARPEDVDFLVDLANHEEVEPYLAGGRPRDREAVAAAVERSSREPEEYGRFVIEIEDGAGVGWRLAGSMAFEVTNRRSRIAHLYGLAVHPATRVQSHSFICHHPSAGIQEAHARELAILKRSPHLRTIKILQRDRARSIRSVNRPPFHRGGLSSFPDRSPHVEILE